MFHVIKIIISSLFFAREITISNFKEKYFLDICLMSVIEKI